MKNKNI